MTHDSPDPTVAGLATELLANIDALADALGDRIAGQIDAYGQAGIVSRVDLRRSLVANMEHILGRLSGSGGPDLEVPRRIGHTRAIQDVPLAEVLRAYRLGFTFVWQRLLEAARRSGQASVDALLDTATTVWELADEFSMAMTGGYRETMAERMIAADRRRSGIVAALLEGAGTPSAWEVAKLLGLPYEGKFLVVVVDVADEGIPPFPHVEETLQRLDVVSAWRSHSDHEVGVLSIGHRRAPATVIEELARKARARMGASPPFMRLDGAARALRLAQVAMEAQPVGTTGIRQLEDEPLVDLLVRDKDMTHRFVTRVLGQVLALPDDDRSTLLATAGAWLDAHGSAGAAAKVLYCHENTVRYRMHRLEDHLGGGLDDPRRLSDLSAALRAIRLFPEMADLQVPSA